VHGHGRGLVAGRIPINWTNFKLREGPWKGQDLLPRTVIDFRKSLRGNKEGLDRDSGSGDEVLRVNMHKSHRQSEKECVLGSTYYNVDLGDWVSLGEKGTFVSGSSSLFGYETKMGTVRILIISQNRCSAIYFKRSRRELSIDMGEHRPTLKRKGVMCILVLFQDRPKVSARAFY